MEFGGYGYTAKIELAPGRLLRLTDHGHSQPIEWLLLDRSLERMVKAQGLVSLGKLGRAEKCPIFKSVFEGVG